MLERDTRFKAKRVQEAAQAPPSIPVLACARAADRIFLPQQALPSEHLGAKPHMACLRSRLLQTYGSRTGVFRRDTRLGRQN
ncbi:hypothetical protein ACX80J_14865 [Arthrobacter sp. MDB2-24]